MTGTSHLPAMSPTPGTSQTVEQLTISFGDTQYLLAQGQDYELLQRNIEKAIRAGGGFVEFIVVGNRKVSALMTGRQLVMLTVGTVLLDDRDTGDVGEPYGGFFDLI